MKFLRLFDWKFILSLALLTLVTHLVINGIAISNDNKAKGSRIDVLITEIQEQQNSAEKEREAAAAERALLLQGQRALARKYDVTLNRQNALLIYLRRHGIEVPPRFLIIETSQTSNSSKESRLSTTTKKQPSVDKKRTVSRSFSDLPGKSEKSQRKNKESLKYKRFN